MWYYKNEAYQIKWPSGKVVNTSACHAEEHGFDPRLGRQ